MTKTPSLRDLVVALYLITILAHSAVSQLATSNRYQELLEETFVEALARNVTSYSDLTNRFKLLTFHGLKNAQTEVTSGYDPDCLMSSANLTACMKEKVKCISLEEIGKIYNLSSTSGTSLPSLSSEDVDVLSPAIVYSLLTCDITSAESGGGDAVREHGDDTPSSQATWGYSLLFVTLINLCALTGAFVLPCMRLKSFKMVLNFMVAIAVGTLVGSGLLFLIPEAFALTHDDEDSDYVWKASTIMGGVYLFYLTERIMRMINDKRENTQAKKKQDELAMEGAITTSFRRIPVDTAIPGKDLSHIPPHLTGAAGLCGPVEFSAHPSNSSSCVEFSNLNGGPQAGKDDAELAESGSNGAHVQLLTKEVKANGHHHHHGHSHGSDNQVAPVAYMIIFGDALHNFIDGLSIGSAFTQSIMTGVSVSVAVVCEELPHELGDLAILLNSGMPFRRALAYNFLSALTCYAGTVIGIMLGENTHSHEWIFAIAGGMFLYISLVDMMPEMNSAAESPEGKEFGTLKMFLLQNVGLLAGYSIMLLMALYGGNIEFS